MDQVIPLYVYGTARIGEPLHSMIETSVVDSRIASAPGTELMVTERGAYPYLVRRIGEEPHTWGDLLLVRKSLDLRHFIDMEVATGYTIEGVMVEHDFPDLPPFALACVWSGSERLLVPLGVSSWLSRRGAPALYLTK